MPMQSKMLNHLFGMTYGVFEFSILQKVLLSSESAEIDATTIIGGGIAAAVNILIW